MVEHEMIAYLRWIYKEISLLSQAFFLTFWKKLVFREYLDYKY